MISRKAIVVAALIVVPLLAYGVIGAYALWKTGLWIWAWLMGPACWVLAWGLARFWNLGHQSAAPADLKTPGYWTPRDHAALAIVREYQQKVEQFTPNQLTEFAIYQSQARSLAEALARHYHPEATDPFSSLTVPELLAAIRLAADDVERWMLLAVPGSRLLTISHWRALGSAPKWITRIQNAAWAVSILINPVNLVKYVSSQLTLGPVTTAMQTELLAAAYMEFMQRAGFYLIEMNSGRLRGGADAYRQKLPLDPLRLPGVTGAPADLAETAVRDREGGTGVSPQLVPAQPVTVALVGQVSAGKSSLVNALTRTQQAAVDVLPETMEVQRYQMTLGDPAVVVTLLDTPGYGDVGATAAQQRQIRQALREAHVVLLVMDAHSPAREADRKTLTDLEGWYAGQPSLKPPPMLGVLTHVDLLKPALEWSPPYDWRNR